MKSTETTQSSDSTEADRAERELPHSRRGFLKQAAATGFLGLTGIGVVTEDAKATQSTGQHQRPEFTSPEARETVAAFNPDGYINLYGQPTGGDYQVLTTGPIRKGAWAEADSSDETFCDANDCNAFGRLNRGGRDNYIFKGYLKNVIEIQGDISYEIGRY